MGRTAALKSGDRGVSVETACADFTAGARQIAGKPAPTPSGQKRTASPDAERGNDQIAKTLNAGEPSLIRSLLILAAGRGSWLVLRWGAQRPRNPATEVGRLKPHV
jgi:hypothetical protein